jgi:4-hydroxy-tetrahydrodipicolinate synthase
LRIDVVEGGCNSLPTEEVNTGVARFQGVFALLLTPFHNDGSIDWRTYDTYVSWQLSAQPQGLFAVCGSSEMKWLTLDERLALARRAVQLAGGVPVVATANLEPDPALHPQEMQRMAETGVSGVVLTPPPGYGTDQARLGDYFASLVSSAPCPTLIYEWPQVQPYLIDPVVFGRLVNEHGLVGIKDTTCTMEGILAKIEQAPNAAVFQANMPYALAALRQGACGLMAVVSAAAADLTVRFWQSVKKGEPAAEALHSQLVFLDAVLRGAYPATAKHLARLRGIPVGPTCRWPVSMPPEIAQAMEVWHRQAVELNLIRSPRE